MAVCQAAWRQRRAVNTLAAARQFAAALRRRTRPAIGPAGNRCSPWVPSSAGARSELTRGVAAVTFSPSRRQDRIGLQQPRGVHRKLCSRGVVPAMRTVDRGRVKFGRVRLAPTGKRRLVHGAHVKRTSRIALCMSQLGGKRTVGRRLRPPIRFPPASFESRGDRCACPTPSIRAAPMRRRSFAAASPRPDLQPRRALFRNSFSPRPASSSSRTMHRG